MSALTLKLHFQTLQARIDCRRLAEFDLLANDYSMSNMKELKCERCQDLFVQDYRNLEVCSQCAEETEVEE
jgi:hypothetical protein